jgi:hypothetical protein
MKNTYLINVYFPFYLLKIFRKKKLCIYFSKYDINVIIVDWEIAAASGISK